MTAKTYYARTAAVASLCVTAALGLSACQPGATHTASSASPGLTVSGSPGGSADNEVKAVPRLVGKGLQAAQDAAQSAGFHRLTSHDSTGRDRHQLLDRDWKVCSQQPAAGSKTSTGSQIDLGAVKSGESCPSTDRAAPAKAGSTMPDFTGKALTAAAASLPTDTTIRTADASGNRSVTVWSDWKVCGQKPAPGVAYKNRTITFTAVKFGEQCP